jgi:hypothetical protein
VENIFIAVGGSGTKVAEALVRLLAIGFPTRYQADGAGRVLTSAGDTLRIWRVDPDSNSGASTELDRIVNKYRDLQSTLEDHWAMTITDVTHLDPLILPKRGEGDNIVKSLKGVLDSPIPGNKSSRPFLDLFFEEKDLEIQVDRGFYQKPFIGSAIMALFVDSLLDPSSNASQKCGFKALEGQNVRFFLCGSLHGGTGACGVPVLGQFLKRRKDSKQGESKWLLGACLLGPYHSPPALPFAVPKERKSITGDEIRDFIRDNLKHPAFETLTDQSREELARQILQGFYADPDAMPKRASQSLSYYRDTIAEYFDQLFVVGKETSDTYATQESGQKWSNGGLSQNNPLNSAEVVAAISALSFFADSPVERSTGETYTIACSTEELDSKKVTLHDLPLYKVGSDEIDPEKVFLAAAMARHFIMHQIPWEKKATSFPSDFALRKVYEQAETKKIHDKEKFDRASALFIEIMKSTVGSQASLGWSPDVARELYELLATDKSGIDLVEKKLEKPGWLSLRKPDRNLLGGVELDRDAFELARWLPAAAYNRGDYWRCVWANIYKISREAVKLEAAAA